MTCEPLAITWAPAGVEFSQGERRAPDHVGDELKFDRLPIVAVRCDDGSHLGVKLCRRGRVHPRTCDGRPAVERLDVGSERLGEADGCGTLRTNTPEQATFLQTCDEVVILPVRDDRVAPAERPQGLVPRRRELVDA